MVVCEGFVFMSKRMVVIPMLNVWFVSVCVGVCVRLCGCLCPFVWAFVCPFVCPFV